MCADTSSFDDACEYAIQFLLNGQGSARHLTVKLAEMRAEATPLELMFILSMAASSIEEVLGGREANAIAADVWRTASLIGVDLYMMNRRGLPSTTCRDLMRYWQTVDGYFLE